MFPANWSILSFVLKCHCKWLVFVLSCCLCLACATQRENALSPLGPIHIKSEGRDGYYFTLSLTRLLERRGAKVTNKADEAHSHISLQGPNCQRTPLLLAPKGSDVSDYRIRCLVHYDIQIAEQEFSGSLSASDNLIATEPLSAFYRQEEELMDGITHRLARQLIRALVQLS